MEGSKMRNIVVLKNLPSNIVDEAIIILKQNKKIKKIEHVEKTKRNTCKEYITRNNEYVLKEAELLVSNYIEENKKEGKKEVLQKNEKLKLKKLKRYSICTTIALFISLIFNLL